MERQNSDPQVLRPIWLPYGAPLGAAYSANEVRIPAEDGILLAGTLTVPNDAEDPLPAVIMITGSGQNNRNQGSPPIMPFREIADALSSRGITVLRIDDRGVGGSTGDVATATTFDEARDVRAALSWLRSRKEIDPDRVALVGWSEGGFIGPMIAAEDPSIAAMALLNGSLSGVETADYQVRYAVGKNPAVLPENVEATVAAALAGFEKHPRSAAILTIDAREWAGKIRMPVLLISGGSDRHVPPWTAAQFAAAFRASGNDDITMALFPTLSHIMLPDPDGRSGGWPFLPSARLPENVTTTLADWLVNRLCVKQP